MLSLQECLADIHLAQSLGFPAASEHKLHKRRALCLAGKQESSGARRASESDPHCSSSTTTSVASELCCVLVSPAKGHYTVVRLLELNHHVCVYDLLSNFRLPLILRPETSLLQTPPLLQC